MSIEECPDATGPYRYIWRQRDLNIGRKQDLGEAVFLMRNPATEEENRDQGVPRGPHTTRNICRSIARRLGYATFTEINLFAFRAKNLPTLYQACLMGRDIVGPENDNKICEVVSQVNFVIVGWGNPGGPPEFRHKFAGRITEVRSLLEGRAQQIYCLQKKNADAIDFPPHPLGSKKVHGIEDLIPWPPVL